MLWTLTLETGLFSVPGGCLKVIPVRWTFRTTTTERTPGSCGSGRGWVFLTERPLSILQFGV